MIAMRNMIPLAVFSTFLTGTTIFRKLETPRTPTSLNAGSEKSTGPSTKTVRPESVSTEVRALVRDGKIEAAREKLRELGLQDPAAFFKILNRLPGLPGMEDIIKEVAAGLPWNDPTTTDFLNSIGTDTWRILAWQGYITAQVGLRSDQEIYDVGVKAFGSACAKSLAGLLADAAEKRPEAMLPIIGREGDMEIYTIFFDEIMKFHPERASELIRSIPDGTPGSAYNKGYLLSTVVKALPTVENLQTALLTRGSRGFYEQGSSSFLVCSALSKANPQQKTEILEWIGTQQPIARNRLLEGFVFLTALEYPIPSSDFSKVLNTYTSGIMQEKALENWLKQNKDIEQKEPGWIDQLPTERLRNHALALKGKQFGG